MVNILLKYTSLFTTSFLTPGSSLLQSLIWATPSTLHAMVYNILVRICNYVFINVIYFFFSSTGSGLAAAAAAAAAANCLFLLTLPTYLMTNGCSAVFSTIHATKTP